MLALLPLLAYLGILLTLANLRGGLGWRRAALRSAILWGCYLTAVTELLSLIHAIQAIWLTFAWGGACLFLGVILIRCARQNGGLRIPRVELPKGWGARALLGAIAAVVILTAVVAWFAPPQTWDSLNYHMSRVAHWAQDRSVAPLATGIETQNSRTP